MTNKTRLQFAGLSLLLFAVGAYICRELFTTEYLNHMDSIESLFISIARYARDNWTDLTWFPLWMCGMPYQNTYVPGLHLTTGGFSALAHISPALAYHMVTAFFYCLGPVALFWLCYRLSRSLGYSFFAGLAHAVLSPSAFLIADVRSDMGRVFGPRRLQALVTYGEGPHVAGMALMLIALIAVDAALKKRRPHFYVLAAVACAATALTNWLSGVALGLGFAALVTPEMITAGRRPAIRILASLAGVAALAYCFVAPWQPPSTIRAYQFNALTIGGDFRNVLARLPLRAIILAAIFAAIVFLLHRARASRALQFGILFALITGALALSFAWWKLAILPQPHRYHLEMEIGIAALIPFALQPLLSRTSIRIQMIAAAVAIIAAIVPAGSERQFAKALITPIDIRTTVEYKTAMWFDQHMRDRRVMAPGSSAFWLNAFTDTPQIGGNEQGAINFMDRVAVFVLYSSYMTGGKDAEIAELWLKSLGIHAIAMGGPNSREAFKPFAKPYKFVGRFQELWREGDDFVYQVPQRSPSLARIVTRADLPARTPIHGLDVDPLRPYVAALDNPALPLAEFRWTSRHSAEISATLKPEHVISVQENYHAGWHATVNRTPARIAADALGHMVIEPRCNGSCEVQLWYDGGLEMWIVRVLAWAAILGSLVWMIVGWSRNTPISGMM